MTRLPVFAFLVSIAACSDTSIGFLPPDDATFNYDAPPEPDGGFDLKHSDGGSDAALMGNADLGSTPGGRPSLSIRPPLVPTCMAIHSPCRRPSPRSPDGSTRVRWW